MRPPREKDAVRREELLDVAIEQLAEGLVDLLIASAEDPDGGVRGTAAYGLGEVADERAVPTLIHLVEKDPDESVVLHALKALESFRDSRVHECLLKEAERPRRTRSPRWYSATQLRWYDSAQSIAALLGLLADRDALVRQVAEESLFRLRPDDRDRWERLAAEQDY